MLSFASDSLAGCEKIENRKCCDFVIFCFFTSCAVKSDAPVACGRGYFSSEGSLSCTECPVGFYCPLLINSSPQPCASGFYANETKSDSCKECDRGMQFVLFMLPSDCACLPTYYPANLIPRSPTLYFSIIIIIIIIIIITFIQPTYLCACLNYRLSMPDGHWFSWSMSSRLFQFSKRTNYLHSGKVNTPFSMLISKQWFKCSYTAIRERLLEKVHGTIPKGILGSFEFTFLQRNLKEWHERPWTYVCEC